MGSAYYCCAGCKNDFKVTRGNNSASARYAKWLESQGYKCDECRKAERAAEYAAKVAAASVDSRNQHLPELSGTEKQVQWAQSIRLDVLSKMDEALLTVQKNFSRERFLRNLSEEGREEILDGISLIAHEIQQCADARIWIDDYRFYTLERHITVQFEKRMNTLAPTAFAEYARTDK
ncbi:MULTISPECIES: hypothetical protein [Pectobacterium]|uniref:hypothetical protein n=1 Tax=Pectobacterium TaxID=122277 RepID=UPI001374201C|nr:MULTISPECIES: hypothetical protein [Pectobacterium]QHP82836.1 hypothetical protein EO763_23390 [Pectobacterium odoriferum]QQK74062.1 hypothetical protein HG702_22355 [Pectobacterium versatile]